MIWSREYLAEEHEVVEVVVGVYSLGVGVYGAPVARVAGRFYEEAEGGAQQLLEDGSEEVWKGNGTKEKGREMGRERESNSGKVLKLLAHSCEEISKGN
ncbi:hypothetical protein FACS189472_15670 [Alphaproteobacteria bacterium]|nr:hypothetical protein FACS189472_15670 [Alphaproteobacteria bacterium]